MRRILAALLATTIVALPVSAMADWTRGAQGTQGTQEQNYPNGQQGQTPNGGDYRRDNGGDNRGNGDWGRGRRGCDAGSYNQIQSQLQNLNERVRQGQYDGSYTRDSARNFYRAIALDQQYLEQYRSNDGCLDQREASDVQYRIDQLRQQMRQYDRRRGGRRW